ncbi:MAG: dihydroneopterin aldolase [Bacteroidia bacterium]|nr:dihydroneopterin aldolase [Bacteroidia bacterium]
MAIIALEGMRFFAHHGVFEQERQQGNHFEVDVWLDTGDVPLPDSDQLEDALDYGKVYLITAEIMATPKNLLETLVNAIGKRLLETFPLLVSAKVRVSKENPPVAGICRRSYVEATFCP